MNTRCKAKPFLSHGIATALGMENAKTSLIPESISEKPQDDDDQPLTPSDARTFKTCVDTSRHSAQREYTFAINEKPDDDSNAKAQEAYPLLAWHKWRSSSLSRMRSANMGTDAKDESSFERRSRAIRRRLGGGRRLWSSTTFARMEVQNGAAALGRLTEHAGSVQTQRTRPNETCRAEDAHSAGMAENGTTSISHSIDSRQFGRPHDQGHVSRKTDQVRTNLELTRITLRRLEPTCTVTSD